MKVLYSIILALVTSIPFAGIGQVDWPKTITSSEGDLIKVYQWQPEAFANDMLQANAAVSVLEKGKGEPVFGMMWFNANTQSNASQVQVGNVQVNEIRLPENVSAEKLEALKSEISSGMTRWNISLPTSEMKSLLLQTQEEQKLASSYNNNPPKIIYSDKPSLLVVIDGSPKLQKNSKWGVEVVVNTPFNIIKTGGKYYLYGGKHWYVAKSATGPYAITTSVPSNLSAIEEQIAQANKDNKVEQEKTDYVISNIIVTTEPAELLQSNGEPNFAPIPETNLLYVRNSENDIFMDVTGQQYYVLLSGRWYRSASLSGKWQFVASDKLPADFAKIPEGSPKDNVLVSVAGTLPANDAVLDAKVPQTAKVDRKSASANIEYDGNPQFEDIDGTDLQYAINTPAQVIRWRGVYYAVDNGVWFRANSPRGPWVVSAERPYVVTYIPPRYPVYGMKYVYIYDVTPEYIYMGYTPGYLNTYVYGPTVIYGTGYYYRPWFRNHYYARPYTWGFSMHYSPWTGWGFGFNYNVGWFNTGWWGHNNWGYYGWWGPVVYRPAYIWTPYHAGYSHGYYSSAYYGGRRNTVIINNVNIYRNNNIYNYRNDVVTRDNRRAVGYTRSATPVRRTEGSGRVIERNTTRSLSNEPRSLGRGSDGRPGDQGANPSTSGRRVTGADSRNNQNVDRSTGRTAERRDAAGDVPARQSTESTREMNTAPRTQTPENRQTETRPAPVQRQPQTIERRSAAPQNNAPAQRTTPQVNRQQAPQRSVQPSGGTAPQRTERAAPSGRSAGSGSENRARRG